MPDSQGGHSFRAPRSTEALVHHRIISASDLESVIPVPQGIEHALGLARGVLCMVWESQMDQPAEEFGGHAFSMQLSFLKAQRTCPKVLVRERIKMVGMKSSTTNCLFVRVSLPNLDLLGNSRVIQATPSTN